MKILFRIYLVRQKSNTVATTAITHKCNEHGTAISVNYRVQDVNKYRRNELKFGSKYLEQTKPRSNLFTPVIMEFKN